MAAAGLIAAGAVGAATLVRIGDDPPPPVAARATPGRTGDDALLDAIERRSSARVARTPAPAALHEYRDWIAGRFGPARDGLLLP